MLRPFDGQRPAILFPEQQVFVDGHPVNQDLLGGEEAAEDGQQSEQIRRGDGAVGIDVGVVGQRDRLREAQARHEEQESE